MKERRARVCVCVDVCVHLQIVLEVTSHSRGIHPETPGPHHTRTFHSVPEGAARAGGGAGGERPFTCTVIYIKVNLHLQQQQLEQTDPLTFAQRLLRVGGLGCELVANVFLINARSL